MLPSRRTRVARLPLIALLASAGCSACNHCQKASFVRHDEIPAGGYAVVADVHAKPGMEDELRRITLPLIEQVRGEPNNVFYMLHEDREHPGHFVFYEIFARQEDFEAHNRTAHVQAWFAELPRLAEGGVNVVRMKILAK